MPKRIPPYPLQAVLDQLFAEREQRQGAVAEVLADVQAAQEQVVAARNRLVDGEQRLGKAEAETTSAIERGIRSAEIQRHHEYVVGLRQQMAGLEAALRGREAALRTANDRLHQRRTELTEASTRVKLQERHRDNWLTERRREQQRKTQQQESEIGRLLHQRRIDDA